MAKPTKVKYDVSDDDECESDACRSDDDDEEYSRRSSWTCVSKCTLALRWRERSAKNCAKKVKSLEQSFDELNASHESLREDHEMLGKAHSKLKKAHSSLLKQVKEEEAKKEQVIVSYDVGLTCDIIDESFL